MKGVGIYKYKKHQIKIAQAIKLQYVSKDQKEEIPEVFIESDEGDEDPFDEEYNSDQCKDISFDAEIEAAKISP
jgi:hypothetical protein